MKFLALLALLLSSLVTLTTARAGVVVAGGYKFLEQADGTLYRIVLGSGSSHRIDVVFVGDAFSETEQTKFDDTVKSLVSELLAIDPYSSHACAFNFWAVNLIGSSSGTMDCEAAGDSAMVDCDGMTAADVAAAAGVPTWDVLYIVLNDDDTYLATAYPDEKMIISSTRVPYGIVPAHELGHILAGLGDEYQCKACDGSDSGRAYSLATLGEPVEPNLTTHKEAATVPWSSQVSARSMPTKAIHECNGSAIGAWEGGGYYATGIYRPAEYCLMDGVMCAGNDPFCEVCRSTVETALVGVCSPLTLGPLAAYVQLLEAYAEADWRARQLRIHPFPPCYVCDPYFYEPHPAILRMHTNAGADARLIVQDSEGREIVRSGPPAGGVLEVAFTAEQLRSYVVVLDSGPPVADRLELRTELIRHGRHEPLD